MNKEITTIDSLKDSQLMFDKNIPAFGYMMIIIISAIFALIVIWSIKTPKLYTIQAQGTVTNLDSNYVMCTYTGIIDECNLQEGVLVEEGDVLFTVKSTDYDLQETQLLASKETYKKTIQKYELLVKSIKEDNNLFDVTNSDDGLYYSTFEAYKAMIAQNILDATMHKSYGYTDEQIRNELIKNQGKISEIYYSAIQVAENAILEAELQIASIDSQLAAVKKGRKALEIKATTSGVLHLIANYKSGMMVQTAMTVATITPENSIRVIEAYVSTSDMVRMHEGDSVQIVIDGLSQNVYGTISGTVMQIDSNVTAKEESDGRMTQVFRVLINMDNDYLVSATGDKVEITNGMTAIARIQYDEVTYFNYIMEKMGFKVR